MTDQYLGRLSDRYREEIKEHRDALHIGFGDQLVLAEINQDDGGDDQLREVIQKGFHRRRNADFEHRSQLHERKRPEQLEDRRLFDLGKQNPYKNETPDRAADCGRDCRALDSHARNKRQIHRRVEKVHPYGYIHRDLGHSVVADDYRNRSHQRL